MTIDMELALQEADEPSRDQGRRPTCLAFVISDLNRRAAPGILSPEYIYRSAAHQIPNWAPGNGLLISAALNASTSGQPEEYQFPYEPNEPLTPLEALPTGLSLYGNPVQLHSPSADHTLNTLRQGNPLGLVLQLTPAFYSPVDGVVAFTHGVLPGMQHAVLAVGIGKEKSTNSTYIFVRNSWGSGWGINGYAWLPYEYLNQYTTCSFGI